MSETTLYSYSIDIFSSFNSELVNHSLEIDDDIIMLPYNEKLINDFINLNITFENYMKIIEIYDFLMINDNEFIKKDELIHLIINTIGDINVVLRFPEFYNSIGKFNNTFHTYEELYTACQMWMYCLSRGYYPDIYDTNSHGHIGFWDVSKINNMEKLFQIPKDTLSGLHFQEKLIYKLNNNKILYKKQVYPEYIYHCSANENKVEKKYSDIHKNKYYNNVRENIKIIQENSSRVKSERDVYNKVENFIHSTNIILDLSLWDVSNVINMNDMFSQNRVCEFIISIWDVSNVKTMERMFMDSNFNGYINDWNVNKVETTTSMFKNSNFNQPLNNWFSIQGRELPRIRDMSFMFTNTPFNQPINKWNVQYCNNFEMMFRNTPFNQPLNNWDVRNGKNFYGMFSITNFNQPLDRWNVRNAVYMTCMFMRSMFNQNINNWDVGNVKNFDSMFYNSNFNQPLHNWDMKNAKNISFMFACTPFNQNILKWNVSNVEYMSGLFACTPFNKQINGWDVSNVKSMKYMFSDSDFNQYINNWNVRNVKTMKCMFKNTNFNKPLKDWDVRNVIDMKSMFHNSDFNQDIEEWDVKKVSDMSCMFMNTKFNKSLDYWETSNLKKCAMMFYNSSFNQSISHFEMRQVVTMERMFEGSDFNQLNIRRWDLREVENISKIFYNSALVYENDISVIIDNLKKWYLYNVKYANKMFYDNDTKLILKNLNIRKSNFKIINTCNGLQFAIDIYDDNTKQEEYFCRERNNVSMKDCRFYTEEEMNSEYIDYSLMLDMMKELNNSNRWYDAMNNTYSV